MAPPPALLVAATGLGALAAYTLAKNNDQQPGRKSSAGSPPALKNVSYRHNKDISIPLGEEQSLNSAITAGNAQHGLDVLSSSGTFRINPEDMLFGCI